MKIFIGEVTEISEKMRAKILANTAIVNYIFEHPEFTKIVRQAKFEQTNKSADDIASMLANPQERVRIKVGTYYKRWTRAIAYEQGGVIYFNAAKSASASEENIAHEVMHALGFKHNGNNPRGNENAVPNKIGFLVAQFKKDFL